MHRRRLLGAIGAAVTMAGCGGDVDTQPDSVPINLNNRGGRQLTVDIEFRERGAGESLVATTAQIDANSDESVYAKPIRDGTEYVLSVVIGEQDTSRTISGGGLRNVTVDIHSASNVDISRVDT